MSEQLPEQSQQAEPVQQTEQAEQIDQVEPIEQTKECTVIHHCNHDNCNHDHDCENSNCSHTHHCNHDNCNHDHNCETSNCSHKHHCNHDNCNHDHNCEISNCSHKHNCNHDNCNHEHDCENDNCSHKKHHKKHKKCDYCHHRSCRKHFEITTPEKAGHPWEHRITETEDGMAVNGVLGDTIYLRRGRRYCFTFNQTETEQPFEHLLFFTQDPAGGKQGGKVTGDTDPVDYDPAKIPGTPDPFGEGCQSFKIDCDYPKISYYQCKNHEFMGGLVIVKDK
jgi:hypothetical protein